jgi:DNA-binding MarR family transcriptional regulator
MPADTSGKSRRAKLEQELCGRLANTFSSAVVLFHSALAERLGMNVTDFKCVAILNESGPMTAGRLAELTGMSTAATTLVLDRLERAGLVRRERDPNDRRKVILQPVSSPKMERDIGQAMEELVRSMTEVTSNYSAPQLEAIRDFMDRTTQVLQHVATRLKTGT